jgi:hypothetical protein
MMSDYGTERTCRVALHMSAIGGKADIARACRYVALIGERVKPSVLPGRSTAPRHNPLP